MEKRGQFVCLVPEPFRFAFTPSMDIGLLVAVHMTFLRMVAVQNPCEAIRLKNYLTGAIALVSGQGFVQGLENAKNNI